MNYILSPFTGKLDAVRPPYTNAWSQIANTFQTTSGSGVGAFQITGIPFDSTVMLEYRLMGKLAGGNEFYTEKVTKNLYRGSTGNVVQLGSSATLNENFAVNPSRAQSLGAGTYSVTVGSGGVQTINWQVVADYIISPFTP